MSRPYILVVDDEADIRELLSLTLARMGLEAHCAASTDEAFALRYSEEVNAARAAKSP